MVLVEYAALADYATDRGGAITACGLGIDRLSVKQVPTAHPQLFLVAQLRDTRGRSGMRPVSVALADPTGIALSEIKGSLQFASVDEQESVARIVLGFYSIQFPKFGGYHFSLELESEPLFRLKFSVCPSG